MTDSSAGYTFYGRYFIPSETGDDDSFDFSNVTPDGDAPVADRVPTATLLLPYFEVDLPPEIEFVFGNPVDDPFLDTPTDTTLGDDFIA